MIVLLLLLLLLLLWPLFLLLHLSGALRVSALVVVVGATPFPNCKRPNIPSLGRGSDRRIGPRTVVFLQSESVLMLKRGW